MSKSFLKPFMQEICHTVVCHLSEGFYQTLKHNLGITLILVLSLALIFLPTKQIQKHVNNGKLDESEFIIH